MRTIIIPEPQRRAHEHLTDLCTALPTYVQMRNAADVDGAAAARAFAAHREAHPEFEHANTHQTTRWTGILLLTVVAWICDFALVCTFAAFLVNVFFGGAR